MLGLNLQTPFAVFPSDLGALASSKYTAYDHWAGPGGGGGAARTFEVNVGQYLIATPMRGPLKIELRYR